MDCKKIHEKIHEYLDKELTPPQAAEVFLHLMMCKGCGCHEKFEKSLKHLVRRKFLNQCCWPGKPLQFESRDA